MKLFLVSKNQSGLCLFSLHLKTVFPLPHHLDAESSKKEEVNQSFFGFSFPRNLSSHEVSDFRHLSSFIFTVTLFSWDLPFVEQSLSHSWKIFGEFVFVWWAFSLDLHIRFPSFSIWCAELSLAVYPSLVQRRYLVERGNVLESRSGRFHTLPDKAILACRTAVFD